jgi:hypothetical protein
MQPRDKLGAGTQEAAGTLAISDFGFRIANVKARSQQKRGILFLIYYSGF